METNVARDEKSPLDDKESVSFFSEIWHLFVYVIARIVQMYVQIVDDRAMMALARAMRFLWVTFSPKRFRIATDNVALSGLARSREDAERIAYESMYNLILTGLEVLKAPRAIRGGKLQKLVRITGTRNLDKAVQEKRGLILVVAHLGNWELAGVAVSEYNYPLVSVARPFQNRHLYKIIQSIRTSKKQEIISKYGASRKIPELLMAGKFIALLIDQNARKKGLPIPFFGRIASTVKTPAVISLRYRVPLSIVNVYRENGKHVVEFSELIYPEQFRSQKDPVASLLTYLNMRLEDLIRQHPEQWMWIHKRWSIRPHYWEMWKMAPLLTEDSKTKSHIQSLAK